MVHERQRLTLGLKPGDDLLRIHARLDHFDRHPSLHRLALLGDINGAESADPELFQKLVTANDRAGALREQGGIFGGGIGRMVRRLRGDAGRQLNQAGWASSRWPVARKRCAALRTCVCR